MKKRSFGNVLILFGFFLIIICFHQFAYIGHYGFDDLYYARLANNFNNGQVDLNDHYSYRLPIIVLTAVSYKLFGINDFASSLPSIFISFSILFIVFLILKNQKRLILLLGLALTCLNNWSLFYSDKLMPDIYITLAVLFCLFIIYNYKFVSKNRNNLLHGFLLSIGLLFGFLSKETIVLIIPLLAYFFVFDLILKRDMKFWITSIVLSFLVFVVYFLLIWYFTGDILKRFHAIINNSYLNLCSYDQQNVIVLIKRVAYEFYTMMIYQGMIVGFLFILAYFFQKNGKKVFSFYDPVSFFSVSALILFLSSNYMSISLTDYVPMCLDPRHFLFIIPIAAIPAAYIMHSFFSTKQYSYQILLTFLIVIIISFFLPGSIKWNMYLPLLALVILVKYLPDFKYNLYLYSSLFILIFLANLLGMVKYARHIGYDKQREIVQEYFNDKNPDCYIITNEVQKKLCIYYGGFAPNNKCTFLSFNEINIDSLPPNKPKYLLRNWYTEYLSSLSLDDLPLYAKEIDPSSTLIYQNESLNISIYKLDKIIKPHKILHCFNGYEQEEKWWQQKPADLRNNIKYSGQYSCFVHEFSSTFVYPFDSLQTDSCRKILINCSMFCRVEKPSAAQLVISLETEGKVYIWKALVIGKYIRAYSNWCPLNYEVSIDPKEILKNSTLKVYLWNTGKKETYIDDFAVDISTY